MRTKICTGAPAIRMPSRYAIMSFSEMEYGGGSKKGFSGWASFVLSLVCTGVLWAAANAVGGVFAVTAYRGINNKLLGGLAGLGIVALVSVTSTAYAVRSVARMWEMTEQH